MISPNLVLKLNIILFTLFGVYTLIVLDGFNKIVGAFFICYVYVNMLSLKNKGKRKFKLNLLKINICVLAILACYLIFKLCQEKNRMLGLGNPEHLSIALIISLIALVLNYLSIKAYKIKSE
jgi:hypothetical protein